MKEESIFNNGFFEFLNTEEEYNVNGENKLVKRQMVRRSPGVRALIIDKKANKILLSKEYRYELKDWDYRLPGGKVFDTLKEYKESIARDDIFKYVELAVFKETKEEVGIKINNPKLIKVSKAGAGVVWDLYYFEITEYEIIENGQELGENEFVSGFEWKSFDEIIDMCINSKINEERTVGVLLTYILKSDKNSLNSVTANLWLAKLKKYWFEKDLLNATGLFKKTKFYQETPFIDPYESFEEIVNEWQHVKNEDIKEIDFNVLAIDNNCLIVEWHLEQNKETLKGIYEIKFNKDLECISFRSWEMRK